MKRVHNSITEEIDLNRKYFLSDMRYNLKPAGLWYGIDGDWIEWCESEMPHWVKPYYYELEFVENINLLLITNLAELKSFNDKYSVVIKEDAVFPLKEIDWVKVMKDYDGIEIQNYHSIKYATYSEIGLSLSMIWFSGWDCNSGCVWNLGKVKVKRLEEIK